MTDDTPPSYDDHKAMDADQDPRPVVALPPAGLPGAAIALIAILAATILFFVLDTQRRNTAARSPLETVGGVGTFSAPPPLIVPPDRPSPPRTVTVVTEPAPQAPAIAKEAPQPFTQQPSYPAQTIIVPQQSQSPPAPPLQARQPTNSPSIVFDAGVGQTLTPSSTGLDSQGGGQGQGGAGQSSLGWDLAPARATQIGNRTTIMPTGTIIPAVLETPIDTARPGLVRAVISQDTRGFDGMRVLVPRGARLIGEYQSDVRSGQNRVLVTWTRLIRPDGVTIRLGSPAADPLGGAGIPGNVHSFFLQRFASAVLQSALTVGVNLASRPASGSVIVGLPGTANTVGQALLPPNDLRPKITVKQGAALNVFVARDLDFSGVPARP